MKNIAKGITLFLMILLMCALTIICSYAVIDKSTTEIQKQETKTRKEDISVLLTKTNAVRVIVVDNSITIENQSNLEIYGMKVKINIENEEIKIAYRKVMKGFESYYINLEEYFTEDFLEGKDLSVSVEDCMTVTGLILYILVCILALVLCVFIESAEMLAFFTVVLFLGGLALGF